MTCKSFVCISDCYFLSLGLFLNHPKQWLSRILSLMMYSAFICATATGMKNNYEVGCSSGPVLNLQCEFKQSVVFSATTGFL